LGKFKTTRSSKPSQNLRTLEPRKGRGSYVWLERNPNSKAQSRRKEQKTAGTHGHAYKGILGKHREIT